MDMSPKKGLCMSIHCELPILRVGAGENSCDHTSTVGIHPANISWDGPH